MLNKYILMLAFSLFFFKPASAENTQCPEISGTYSYLNLEKVTKTTTITKEDCSKVTFVDAETPNNPFVYLADNQIHDDPRTLFTKVGAAKSMAGFDGTQCFYIIMYYSESDPALQIRVNYCLNENKELIVSAPGTRMNNITMVRQ